MKTSEQKLTPATLNIAGRTVRSESGMTLIVVIMLMVIILVITGAGLFFSSIDLRISGNYRVGTQSFYAADTGASAAFARIVQDPIASSAVIVLTPVSVGSAYSYCSGTIAATANCTTPQPLPWTFAIRPGDAIPGGKGVTTSYMTFQYQINTTGIGPLGASREVQALASYGPIPAATK
jgi:Tfp pilus assembly protein PilX